MKTIGSFMSALSAVFLGAADACASLSDGRLSSVTSLIDTSQNQAFESQPPAQGLLTADLEPVHSFKLASVQFITGGGNLTFNTPEFPDTSTDNCKRFGYTLTSCSAGNPALFCPYNDKYFKECCDSRYQYDKKDCTYPNTISGDSCGGRFMCYCDRSLYPVESCASPKVTTNDSCTEEGKRYYSGCVCPANYTESCTEANTEGRGTGCTFNGETKYTGCQCKAGYNLTCDELGPVTPGDYCLSGGVKYYNSCKTCENKCTLDECPAGVSCTLEDCSGKYCAVGCAVGSYDLDNYWCGGALRCWVKP